MLQALMLLWTVDHLHPERPWHATVLVLIGALLRAAMVIAVLVMAIMQSLSSGLLAFVGFFVSRTVCVAITSSRMVHPKRPS